MTWRAKYGRPSAAEAAEAERQSAAAAAAEVQRAAAEVEAAATAAAAAAAAASAAQAAEKTKVDAAAATAAAASATAAAAAAAKTQQEQQQHKQQQQQQQQGVAASQPLTPGVPAVARGVPRIQVSAEASKQEGDLAEALRDARARVADYSTAAAAKKERRVLNNHITVHVQQIAATRRQIEQKVGWCKLKPVETRFESACNQRMMLGPTLWASDF